MTSSVAALLVAALLAQCPAAPESDAPKLSFESGILTLASGARLLVKPGCYLNSATCLETGKRFAALEAEIATYKANPGISGGTFAIVISIVGVLAAVAGGVFTWWALK